MKYDELPPERKAELRRVVEEATREAQRPPAKSALGADVNRLLGAPGLSAPEKAVVQNTRRRARVSLNRMVRDFSRWHEPGYREAHGVSNGEYIQAFALMLRYFGGPIAQPSTQFHKWEADDNAAGVVTAMVIAAARGMIASSPQEYRVEAVDADYEVKNGNGTTTH